MSSFWDNFLKGFGSVLTIFPSPREYNLPSTKSEGLRQDAEALAGDWKRIGMDMTKVINRETSMNSRPVRPHRSQYHMPGGRNP